MTILKAGDLIKFLDSTGKGTITEIVGRNRVRVLDEFGFENVFDVNQLVKISEAAPDKPHPIISKPGIFFESVQSSSKNDILNFVLHLISCTQEESHFVLYAKEKKTFRTLHHGVCHPGISSRISSFALSEISDWQSLHVIFSSVYSYPQNILPVHRTFQIKKNQFLTPESWVTIINGKGSGVWLPDLHTDEISLTETTSKEPNYPSGISQRISKPHKRREEIEVDLHMISLTENPEGMTPSQMLELQLSYFRKQLEQAIDQKAYSIIFIHGIGNGTLKKAIREELSVYRQVTYEDAPFHKYGMGATLVKIL